MLWQENWVRENGKGVNERKNKDQVNSLKFVFLKKLPTWKKTAPYQISGGHLYLRKKIIKLFFCTSFSDCEKETRAYTIAYDLVSFSFITTTTTTILYHVL